MMSFKLLVPAAVALAGCSTNNHPGMPGMGSTPAASSATQPPLSRCRSAGRRPAQPGNSRS